ncbi:MAG: DUF3772 domain-containing protein, partial [Sphingomonas sp.]
MLFRLLLATLLATLALPAAAQDTGQIVAVAKSLEASSDELQKIDRAFDQPSDEAERRDLRDRASAVRQSVGDAVALLDPQLAAVDARLGQLGSPTPGVTEAPDIVAQRKLLGQQRSTIDSAIKRGKLIGVEAGQLVDEINQSQAQAFGERMSAAVASPLSPAFWTATMKAAPRDLRRIQRFATATVAQARTALRGGDGWQAAIGLAAALLLIGPVRLALRRAGRDRLIAHAPASRVRRSALALWLVIVGMLVPGFAAVALVQGLRWADMLAPSTALVADDFVRASFVFSLVSSLGGALLLRRQQSWRLLPIGDETADALRPWTWAIAGLGFCGILLIGFNDAVGASYPAREMTDGLLAVLHCGLTAGILFTIGRLRRALHAPVAGEEDAPPPSHTGVALLSLACWLLTVISLGALLLGYINLSLFISRTLIWVAI